MLRYDHPTLIASAAIKQGSSDCTMTTSALPYRTRSKESISKVDDICDVELKAVDAGDVELSPNTDYSGFTQKTDPIEIKLVRKLDLFIMVRIVRGNCYSPTAFSMVHVLVELS